MLSRCYNPSNNSYKAYGAIGVTVCSRWLTLSNFIDDIPLLDGYDSDLYAAGGLELDKDIKQLAVPRGSRVYSPETCCLVTHEVNTSYIDYSTRTHTIYGTDPGGVKHTIAGVDRFAKSHGIPYSSITKVLRGEYDHYRGWHFYRTDPDAIPEEATA